MHDTQTVVDLVADRGLELGIVGAARRHRAVRFEPILEDEVILICPPGHPFAGRTITVDDLRGETLILMQEGAGVRQVVEDELRALGVRLRDLSDLARARAAGVGAQRRAGGLRGHVHLADGGRVGPRGGHARRGAARRG